MSTSPKSLPPYANANEEPQFNDKALVITPNTSGAAPVAVPGDSQLAPPAQYLPDTTVRDYGLKGRLRALKLAWILGTFALRLYCDRLAHVSREEVEGFTQKVLYWFARHFSLSNKLAAPELNQKRAAWLTENLGKLGPTFIKIGQTLSTRPDLVPLEYTKELSKLQDQVPSFPQPIAWAIIEEELGDRPENIFASIDHEPIAAASLGQVYKARLKTGEKVAVKVQRPLLPQVVNLDLAILRATADYIQQRYGEWMLDIDWQMIINEFAQMLFEEMDYHQEAKNAEIFRQNFANWPEIYVPQIHQEYSSRRVLVEEFIDGLKVDDVRGLEARNLVPIEVVKLISRTYLKQLLEDGFFHADPHPGNLRVMHDGRLAFFDFGMVGRISPEMQSSLVDCFFHIVERDVHGLVEDLIALKFLKAGADIEELRPAIEDIFSHYIGIKIGQLKFRELSQAISETIYKLPFTIPPQFTFVLRALTTLEGIGLLIDPTFSFFETVKPYAKEFMFKRESRSLRDKLIGKLVRGEDGKISWSKVWKLTKMAIKHYFTPGTPPPAKKE